MSAKMKSPHPKTRRGGNEAVAQKGLTRERIASDIETFRKAGGRVEVLGTTRVLKKLD